MGEQGYQAKMDGSALQRVEERSADGIARADLPALIDEGQPVIIRGAFARHPLVAAGLEGPDAAKAHISQFASDRPLTVFTADAGAKGRFFYNADLTGLNFEARQMAVSDFFAALAHAADSAAPAALYAGSTDLATFLPGMIEADDLALGAAAFARHQPLVSIWMGNRSTAATHFDMSNNIAVCMVGARRFTLFPPDQIANLYPGPLWPTPAGQVVSMVDLHDPDFERYPRFADALKHARIAELLPGDAIVYPAMWWHQVDALDDHFNVLINYWWNEAPAFLDSPMNTVLHGLLSLRDRPVTEKRAWRALFDYYVFDESGHGCAGDDAAPIAGAHLPSGARGPLAPLDAATARRLRSLLLNRLNR